MLSEAQQLPIQTSTLLVPSQTAWKPLNLSGMQTLIRVATSLELFEAERKRGRREARRRVPGTRKP